MSYLRYLFLFVWWCLAPLSTILQWQSVLIGGGNRRTRRKPPTCRKSLINVITYLLYTSPWSIFELATSVVICTDCIGSCKSNYHTITVTTCLFAHSDVLHVLCCVFALFVFILCTLCCQFLWMTRFWLPLLYSLTFILCKWQEQKLK